MAISSVEQVGRLLRGREVQFKAVAITALSSYFLQLFGLWLHWALWAIVLVTIIPWIPLFSMKILWTSKHYGFMALYLSIMILQAGHVGEHVVQMLQFIFIYNPAHHCFGWSWYGICSDAHGVFGELDRELVHFVWDGLILVATIIIRIHFRNVKNIWLTLAIVAATIHQIEHCELFGTYLFANDFYMHGGVLFGIHVPDGFGAQDGILGHNGLVGSLTGLNGPLNTILPSRINIHFLYNSMVFIPMVLGFRKQLQRIYDEWLAKALPQLNEEQLIAVTARSENAKFAPGQVVFNQGDPSNMFYIITKGHADVLRKDKNGNEMQVARLSEGQYFGEIGLLGNTPRTATIKAVDDLECLALKREVFKEMLASSGAAYKDVDIVLRRRLVHLGALQGLPLQDLVNADQDTILKTRMIRDRLRMLQPDDLSRIFGRPPTSVHPSSPSSQPFAPQPAMAMAAPAAAQPVMPQPAPMGQTMLAQPAVAVADQPTIAPARETPPPQPAQGFHRGVLLVRTGPSAGLRYEITTPRLIIGRRGSTGSSTNHSNVPTLLIDDARISRNHLELIARPDGMYARDMGSANGSRVNGTQIGGEPVRLEDGAEILLGYDSILSYRNNA